MPFTIPYKGASLESINSLSIMGVVFSSPGYMSPLNKLGSGAGTNAQSTPGRQTQHGFMKLGFPVFQRLIADSKVPLKLPYFILKSSMSGYGTKGDIWAGPCHKNPTGRGYMAGPSHVGSGHPSLTLRTCANYKIKDLRMLSGGNKINGFSVDNVTIPVRTFQGVPIEPSGRVPGFTRDSSERPFYTLGSDSRLFFSQPIYSRQTDGSCTAFLSFDILKWAKQNVEFSSIIKNPSSLLSCLSIKRASASRIMADGHDLSSYLTPDRRGFRVDQRQRRPAAALPNGLQFVDTSTSSGNILSMLIKDPEMANLSPRSYAYRVEFQIECDAKKVIEYIITDIKDKLDKYEVYFQAFAGAAGRKLNQERYLKSNISYLEAKSSAYIELVNVLLGSLDFFYVYDKFKYLKNNLRSLASPHSATEESAAILRDMASAYLSSLERLLGSSREGNEFTKDYSSKRLPANGFRTLSGGGV